MQLQSPPSPRLSAIDWMRGLVMVLMTIDHASDAFNANRSFADSALFYKVGSVIPAAQFFTRWITHLCAPTFVFLAGASLAISVSRRQAEGDSASDIDRHIITRGLFIALLDPLWMSLGFFGWSHILFQVLYAIGLSLVFMAALRRLPPLALALLGLSLIVGVDAVVGHMRELPSARVTPPLLFGLLVSGARFGYLIVGYPVASWLGIMMLGWAFGDWRRRAPQSDPSAFLFIAGALSLCTFYLLRAQNGFGNMALHRDDNTLVQWLHVSKYPPSITYCALELGIMAILLAGFFFLARSGRPALMSPLEMLGQNAMFYYLLHLHLLMLASYALGLHQHLGLRATYLSAAITVVALYFACAAYGRYKRTHRNLLTIYV